MNAILPEVFDLSSLSRALDEDIAAQEHAAIDYVPMDVDDEWTPAPVLCTNNTPRPWYNPEPQPAWNNLEFELQDLVENASQNVPGWYVNLWGPNDQPRPIWRDLAPISTPPTSRPWHNPEPQPAWNNLELELNNSSVKNVSQDVPGSCVNTWGQNDQPRNTWPNLLPIVSVRKVENAHARYRAPNPVLAPRSWQKSEPKPMRNNLKFKVESPLVENTPQVQNQDVPGSSVPLRGRKDRPHHTEHAFMPVVSVRKIENVLVREATTPAPTAPIILDRKEQKAPALPPLATKVEKAHVSGVPVSAMKMEKAHVRIAPNPARKAGKARVPGISASARRAGNTSALGVLTSVKNNGVLDVPASARKIEKSRAPFIPTPSPLPSKSTSIRSKPVVPPRVDFTNMSSSSKVRLEDMPKVDEHPVQMHISWPALVNIVQPGPPKTTTSHHSQNSPTTHTCHARTDGDVVMIENDYIVPAVSVPTTEEDVTSDDTHPAHLSEPLQSVVDHTEDGEPNVDRNAAPEDDVGTSDAEEENPASVGNKDEAGEDKSEETEEETEEERQARVARLMTEVFGDGEDSDDEETPLAKDAAVSLDYPSTSAISDVLTVDATESITDWSLDTPDDAGIEGNGSVEVADRDEEDEERQANYRAQLLIEIFGDGDQIVQEVPFVPVLVPATRDPRKRKREDDGPSPMANLVIMDPRKRKHDGEALPAPTLVTRDPRKRRREDDALPMSGPVTMDYKKRKRDGEALPAPTRDPRKRKRENDAMSILSLVAEDCRKRKREDEIPPALSVVTRDPRKRLKG